MNKINLAQKLSLINDHWNPRITGELNGQLLKLVKFQGLNGESRTLRVKDLLARAVQHECDHLDGVLCNSKVPGAGS